MFSYMFSPEFAVTNIIPSTINITVLHIEKFCCNYPYLIIYFCLQTLFTEMHDRCNVQIIQFQM
jgi:hypothetical protein